MNTNKTAVTFVAMGSFAVPVTFQMPVAACNEAVQSEQSAADATRLDQVEPSCEA